MKIVSLFVALVACATPSVESHEYETEVAKLMNIIIHSLYKSKDIFLRELISNAADALDKVRYQALTNKAVMDANPDMKITILADKEAKTLTIRDTGIGMSKESLRLHLGTIAKSGTSEFATAAAGNATDLIGQFGVGFYSSFLVADSVSVISKSANDSQHIWKSTSQNGFTIAEDPRGNTLGRGSEIILTLKDDALDFLEEKTLRKLVGKYSEFINFPIYLWSTKEQEKEIVEPLVAEEEKEPKSDVEDVTEEVKKDDAAPVEKEMEMVSDWELLNTNKPIWTRNPSEIDEDEYHDFYKGLFKETMLPMAFSHFKAEGDTEFKSIVFIPHTAPKGFMEGSTGDSDLTKNVKMFVRRVFITEELPNFLPRWLAFMKVMVDSNDLPLSVSRDTLQNHPKIVTIRKKVIGKCLDLIISLEDEKSKVTTDTSLFETFFKQFKIALKYGLYDSKISSHTTKLIELMRWDTTIHNFTGLASYVDRMKDKQPQIYYSVAPTYAEAMGSPLVESLIARGYEVLIMTDQIDEYLTQDKVKAYKSFPLQNVGKSGLMFGDEEDSVAVGVELKKKFEPLTDWLKDILSSEVEEVELLTSTAAVVLPSKMGLSAAAERMMTFQSANTKNEFMNNFYRNQKRVLQINPNNPMIAAMLEKVVAGTAENLELFIPILFETYAVGSGYDVRKPFDFVKSFESLLRKQVGVSEDEKSNVKVKVAGPRKEKHVEPVVVSDDVQEESDPYDKFEL